jgi:hypothetical protein
MQNTNVSLTNRISIEDLPKHSQTMEDLSFSEMSDVFGGGFLSKIWKKVWNPIKEATGWSTPGFLKELDDFVGGVSSWSKIIRYLF